MVRFLIRRPIAVLMIFIALISIGLILVKRIPLSLLPNVDVPQIVVRINYPNTAAVTLEENILRSIREGLSNIKGLKTVESRAANHIGLVYLTFEYGTNMGLVYIEINEKIDRLTNVLPRNLTRPQVMRINTSDIPIIRMQVLPKANANYQQVSDLTEKVLKKRLEQLDGVSLVDINGKQQSIINIQPDKRALLALGLNESIIPESIRNANQELGGLSLREGQYRYFVKLANALDGIEMIKQLPIRTKGGSILTLSSVANITQDPETLTGYHLFNGTKGLAVTVQKQPDSRMTELVALIELSVAQFKKDYPQVDFVLSQDQSFLLEAGIDNLWQDLIYGGILTIGLLFLLLGNKASPTLMSISIPVSLVITFIFFKLFNISFNIISLSGLALGIGMLIDNSIVVIDNITRKRRSGMSMEESAVQGTNEVIVPVISQVLTTVAVYVPLVLLSGIAGALVLDQSIALSISLGVSLLIAFVLAPLLYQLFLKTPPDKLKEDTPFYTWISKKYHLMISHILKYKLCYFLITISIMPLGIWIASFLPISSLPQIEKKESLVLIDWNQPIDANENLRRLKTLLTIIQPFCEVTEAEVGIKQFLLQQENNGIQKAELYFGCKNQQEKEKIDVKVKQWLSKNYRGANIKIIDAPNAFTQLFTTSTPYLEVRIKPLNPMSPDQDWKNLRNITKELPTNSFSMGEGFLTETNIEITLNEVQMALYGVGRQNISVLLEELFGSYTVSEIKRFGDIKTIRLKSEKEDLQGKLNSAIRGGNGEYYPLSTFVSISYAEQPKFITADKTGQYRSLLFEQEPSDGLKSFQTKIIKLGVKNGYNVSFHGRYFENREQLNTMWWIFLTVLFLIYLILAIQYESLIQPFVVMLTIPLGITGGMFCLWIFGGTLDIMAAVGFVVILGLVVDDPILKIETLNRLEKKYLSEGLNHDEMLLHRMIHEAGTICLKPLLMVSLTTSTAMVPVLFIDGIGNDLQKPLAVVIIGGLTVGTFFTTWFVPLSYWYISKWNHRKKHRIDELAAPFDKEN
ncbi:efflux RND transporter permease subunit [Pedobacter sp. Hv1]|uniref:efflux RND transporter permease subunit n=1 Tax=Pedobacter sp. Hv1 TaxID=1740090 RepID=UPI0006D8A85C|nr:efflux RND transporter permease subunit [Pedobacter sp. Hv1]KQB99417.1 hypothetical protein AQF98_17765 [Pedobacter sp. Hv1]